MDTLYGNNMNDTRLLNLSYCDINKSIDDILVLYERIQKQIIQLLTLNPNYIKDILWDPEKSPLIDTECKCQILRTQLLEKKLDSSYLDLLYEEHYKCSHCNIFERLLIRNYEINTYPLIEIDNGKYKGRIFKVISYENIYPNINIIDLNNKIYKKYIITDKFTNIILSNLYIKSILEYYSIPGIKNVLTGFICGNNGYILADEPNILSLDEFIDIHIDSDDLNKNSTIIYGLLLQLFSIMSILSEYSVSIFNISNKTFNFIYYNINYVYDGVTISNNISLVLNLSDGCAIDILNNSNINKYRLYQKNIVSDNLTSSNPFTLTKSNHKYLSCNDKGICKNTTKCFYRINDGEQNYTMSKLILNKYRNIGFIENSSFEAYLLFITLMINPTIYNIIINTPFLLNIWIGLWHPNEYNQINRDIQLMHDIDDIILNKKIEPLLMSYKLRCDAIEYIWSSLKG